MVHRHLRMLIALVLSGTAVAICAESSTDGDHWSFQPLRQVAPPDDPSGWAETDLDRFVIAKLREKGLRPVELADRRTLIRRVYLDLIGLPPSPEEIVAFLADESPDAYSKLVDRLLSSSHYGERWGRHWLDVVRYADTAGDNSDCPVPEIYLYRDYVIDSFNADLPYDAFLQEQLAGDILAEDEPHTNFARRKIASGYIALAKRFGNSPYEYRHMIIGDLIDCTGRGIMGITMGCARCHDHKFDPMSNEDYYALYGLFESTGFSFSGSEASKDRQKLVSLLYSHDEYLARKKQYDEDAGPLQTKIRELEGSNPITNQLEELNKRIPKLEEQIKLGEAAGEDVSQIKQELERLTQARDKAGGELRTKLRPLKEELAKIDERYATLFQTVAFAASEAEPTDVALQRMGDPDQPGDVVRRGAPSFLCDATSLDIPEARSGRLEFARWLTEPGTTACGLTARVMVNRIWQHHFGKGLVSTPSNFGVNGQRPTHPDLLEWLAVQFEQRGWSIKTMHRLILQSKTYRLSNDRDVENLAIDPDAKWLWRYSRHRLDAEVVRDAMLLLSGNLDKNRPGPHPFPPADQWTFTQHNPFKDFYPSKHRSVYLMTPRNQRHPYLAIFDGPDPNLSTGLRTRSILPQQALYLMNNPFVREQAEGFADQLIKTSSEVEQRIDRAHQLAWGRAAEPGEIAKARDFLNRYEEQLELEGIPADQHERLAWTSYARVILTANEFMYAE